MSYDYKYAATYIRAAFYDDDQGTPKVGRVMFQARVNPGRWREQTQKTPYCNEREWLFEDPADIRLYGILVQEANA